MFFTTFYIFLSNVKLHSSTKCWYNSHPLIQMNVSSYITMLKIVKYEFFCEICRIKRIVAGACCQKQQCCTRLLSLQMVTGKLPSFPLSSSFSSHYMRIFLLSPIQTLLYTIQAIVFCTTTASLLLFRKFK